MVHRECIKIQVITEKAERLFVPLLLALSFLLASISSVLLGRVASGGADDRVLLAADAVSSSLGVALGLSGVDLGLARSVLFTAALSHVVSTEGLSNGLLHGADGGVLLSGGLGGIRHEYL